MKRIFLFLITNLVVVLTLSVVTGLILSTGGEGLRQFFGDNAHLIVLAFVYGMGGSMISLLLSKPMAKLSTKAKTITGQEGEAERWLVTTIEDLARRANLKTPEVAIYPGAANAFATGAFKNSALVAVSSEIMGQMTKEELRAVLGHEMSHVKNGDMVTLGLVQGVMNALVIFFSRVIAGLFTGNSKNSKRGGYMAYRSIASVLDAILGSLGSLVVCAFSRRREYAADAGSAKLLGSPASMIAALRRLGNLRPGSLPGSLTAFGICARPKASLFATHPSLDDRIAALERLNNDPYAAA